MAISVVGLASNGAGSGQTVTVTHGLTLQDNDVVYAFCNKDDSGGGSWTCDNVTFVNLSNQASTAGRDMNSGILRRVIVTASSEPSSWTFSTTQSESKSACIIVLRGVNTTTPEDVALDHTTGTNDSTPDSQDITTVTDGCEILWMCGINDFNGDNVTINQPSGVDGFIGQSETLSDTGLAHESQASSGSTGTKNWPNTPDNAEAEFHVGTVAVRPAGASGPANVADVDGVLKANINDINGVAIANIGDVNGV